MCATDLSDMVSAQEIKFDLKQCQQEDDAVEPNKEDEDEFDVIIKLDDLIAQSLLKKPTPINQMTFGKQN